MPAHFHREGAIEKINGQNQWVPCTVKAVAIRSVAIGGVWCEAGDSIDLTKEEFARFQDAFKLPLTEEQTRRVAAVLDDISSAARNPK